MEKRIQVIDGHLVIAAVVVLTTSEFNTLENKDKNIQKRVDVIAKELAVKWAVETGGNISTCAISRDFGVVVGHQEMHDMELVADKFMKAIRDINLPAVREAVQVDESERQRKVDFVKLLLHDMNTPKDEEDHIIGAKIMCTGPAELPWPIDWGQLSYDLFKEMCELYLEANHETEK